MGSTRVMETSLRDQPKGTHGALKGTETQMASVQEAKKLSFGQELASEQALQSVQRYRQDRDVEKGYEQRNEHPAQIAQANYGVPGMGMGSAAPQGLVMDIASRMANGPVGPSDSILRDGTGV